MSRSGDFHMSAIKTVTRSASSGKFVTKAAAKRNPGGTVTEKH